jgi:glucose/mannose transport system substrate-binding protein
MGDWAKGEFVSASKASNIDYVAVPAPETSGSFLFNIDSFTMFDVKNNDARKAQEAMARLILEPALQEIFNLNKGSIPVRSEMSRKAFDDTALRSLDEFSSAAARGTLLPSMSAEMAVPPAVRGAILDVITNYYNSEISAHTAAQKLAGEVKNAL